MSEPNPYAGGGQGDYQWGPAEPPGATPYGYGYPADATPGYGYPPQAGGYPAPVGGPGAPLLALGDITVVGDSIVTPAGTLPLKGAVWNATDMSRTEEKIPTHAIVLAVVFFVFCFLGLLFLLMKEKQTIGFIQVTVTSGGRHHSTVIPAQGPQTFPWVMGQLNYARSLSAM
ncbi:hypothetical protein QCN29_24225 [Streptomyces sp. HNM0663]|uniref:Uncharacterized protein n=1 Tax=Streptomyces chengmaiensis TaxID=3040919 RepID=A0ABT6HSY4_9ACTN|nr:hypothetical protein [Streptomyces chengmaiensis]MDH2391828.1 hypothetical protein [Streptomyces chengmaiensis]